MQGALQADGGFMLLARQPVWALRFFKVVLLETAVAISRLRMFGAFEMHDIVAGVADVEVPVRRPYDLYRELLAPRAFGDIETALDWLATNRAEISRFLVFHGSGRLAIAPAIAKPKIAYSGKIGAAPVHHVTQADLQCSSEQFRRPGW
jgi:hypothetical protein